MIDQQQNAQQNASQSLDLDVASSTVARPAYTEQDVQAMRWQIESENREGDRVIEGSMLFDVLAALRMARLPGRTKPVDVRLKDGYSSEYIITDSSTGESFVLTLQRVVKRDTEAQAEAAVAAGARAHPRYYY